MHMLLERRLTAKPGGLDRMDDPFFSNSIIEERLSFLGSFRFRSLSRYNHPGVSFAATPMIRILPPDLINQIAAGEVIERPASVLKELVENALDAGATRVDVSLQNGGQTLLRVRDNGEGMAPDDLELCLQRHATSKLLGKNLLDIHTFGFRGEALPSIGAISRLDMSSRRPSDEIGGRIIVEGGTVVAHEPSSGGTGTTVTVRDLFFATPARLKFLKTPRAEAAACVQQLRIIALAHPNVVLSLKSNGKEVFTYTATEDQTQRFGDVLGADFATNSLEVNTATDGISVIGRIGVPTYHGREGGFLFVNRRPIKDRALAAALKVAYQNVLIPGEQPSYALFLTLPVQEVDMNVHPAKTEVRFRDLGRVKGFLIRAVQKTLEQASGTSSLLGPKLAEYVHPEPVATPILAFPEGTPMEEGRAAVLPMAIGSSFTPLRYEHVPDAGVRAIDFSSWFKDVQPTASPFVPSRPSATVATPAPRSQRTTPSLDLGVARAQIFDSFILSETDREIFLIDQHAAHERIVYEQLVTDLVLDEQTGWILFKGPRQRLLFPVSVPLNESETCMAEDFAGAADRMGFGSHLQGTVLHITTYPRILSGEDGLESLIHQLLHEMKTASEPSILLCRIHHLLATIACHNSVRANHPLSDVEQDALLRQIEATPHSSQCNHGRPSFIRLSRDDIERLFERR